MATNTSLAKLFGAKGLTGPAQAAFVPSTTQQVLAGQMSTNPFAMMNFLGEGLAQQNNQQAYLNQLHNTQNQQMQLAQGQLANDYATAQLQHGMSNIPDIQSALGNVDAANVVRRMLQVAPNQQGLRFSQTAQDQQEAQTQANVSKTFAEAAQAAVQGGNWPDLTGKLRDQGVRSHLTTPPSILEAQNIGKPEITMKRHGTDRGEITVKGKDQAAVEEASRSLYDSNVTPGSQEPNDPVRDKFNEGTNSGKATMNRAMMQGLMSHVRKATGQEPIYEAHDADEVITKDGYTFIPVRINGQLYWIVDGEGYVVDADGNEIDVGRNE